MNKSFKHLPIDKRKKILLICDDIRVHSGVATVAKEVVIKSAHHFNWVQMAGAITHPEVGKHLDISKDVNLNAKIEDSSVFLYPVNAYGDPQVLRKVLEIEKPDAIMLITDPRYFRYIWDMESEIRKTCPITYLNIWDDYPVPMYNKPYYEACDLLMGISKQTVNINKLVLADNDKRRIFKYIPHGLNHDIYHPMSQEELLEKNFLQFKEAIFKGQAPKFTLFFNSRNIRRKQIPDSLMAFRMFLDSLPYEDALNCKMILHTERSTDAGTDLYKVNDFLFGEKYSENIIFSHNKLTPVQLNYLYNIADAQILITSNEGWGLTLPEAILSGTPIIANTTGGMQDQMRFIDENGKWFTPSADVPSNHRGTYKEHGEWAFPVYPTSRSIQGSPPTPYIYDDRCCFEDVAERIEEIYNMDPEERKSRGLKGREWAISDEAGFTAEHQGNRVMEAFNELFDTWKPREKYEVINATIQKPNFLNHKIIY